MIEWVLLVAVVALVAANAVFVAAEFSLVTVDRATVERGAERGDRRLRSVLAALRSLSTQLSGAQLGITVTSLLVGYVAEPSLGVLLRGPLQLFGLGAAATPVAFTVAFVAATVFQMVLGELVPKNLAIALPLGVVKLVAGAQRGFTTLTRPLILVLNGSANRVLRGLGVQPQEVLASARSPRELASSVRRSGEHGTLDTPTARLVVRSLEFGAKTAGEVMTPRRRLWAVPPEASVDEVVALARRTGHSRFPVFGQGADDPVGLVHLKHAVAVPIEQRQHQPVRTVMIPAVSVPESRDLDGLLSLLRRRGLQLAIVVDEYGGTAGVVTLEDLVEEIVGEISDEHDRASTRARRLPDGTWRLSGLLRPDEVAEITGIALPEHAEYDTLGGLVNYQLQRLPVAGDRIDIRAEDRTVSVTVQHLDGFRIDRLDLRTVGHNAPDAETGEQAG
ncbi:CBS domain containing-hemolysin-like protein [Saccharopolyspora lacisalsi]|uniref:CBS domain containing-hemolysin-like protein n=1 Tax=Halosaccharopolyspora lacisalsi TaxID=1000566 RepID=A0A839DWN2_9PSEU|nr:hemolysin family protein [Halosaccharopolyspora lacisalsi]MBA8823857.1 CBS domain containing-hemolysin-like protein [Halosaccharopolyspora lacisalsi]